MEFVIVLLAVIFLDLAALRWGVDSREKIDSPEWERRKHFLAGETYNTTCNVLNHSERVSLVPLSCQQVCEC